MREREREGQEIKKEEEEEEKKVGKILRFQKLYVT